MEFGVPAAIFAVIVLGVMFRMFAGWMDRDRIESYVRAHGGRIVSMDWAPFGPGWFGEKSDRIYHVRYRDRDERVHEAHCKTSFTTGVYFTEDRIIGDARIVTPAPTVSASEIERLAEENLRLREEVERLRRGETR